MTVPSVASALDDALDRLMGSDAPLQERLASYADVLRRLNQPFAEAVDRLVARLYEVGAGDTAPMVGEALPAFLLPDESGRLTSLASLLDGGPLVIAFRRGHWCPYCQLSTAELARLQQRLATDFAARIVVISPERQAYSRHLKAASGADFPILSDIDNGYALSLGLVMATGEEMREVMSKRGRDLGAYQGNDAWLLPIPATFVLDRRGTIVMRHVDPDYRFRADSALIVAALGRLNQGR